MRRPGPERPVTLDGLAADALVLGDSPWNGRVWLVEPVTYRTPQTGLRPCGQTWQRAGYQLLCLQGRP